MSVGVVKCSTKERQARAFSIYKTVGSLGFLIFSLFPPLFLRVLGYDGLFGAFTGIYIFFLILSAAILPRLPLSEIKSELENVSMWTCFTRQELFPSYFVSFCGTFTLYGISSTLSMHMIQDFNFATETAYYFYATWAIGFTLANCFLSCAAKAVNYVFGVSFLISLISLMMIGPSHIIIFEIILANQIIFKVIGLFGLGFSSGMLITLGILDVINKAQAWADKEF